MEDRRADIGLRRAAARRPRQAHATVRHLAAALVEDDREAVWGLAMQHLRATDSRLAVFADMLHPAQERLAELWYSSRIGHAAEARAADIVLAVVRRLPATPASMPVPRVSGCILTALPGERHTLGLEMLRAALDDDGWSVSMALDEPLGALLDRVAGERPRFVGVTAGWLARPAPLGTLIEAVQSRGTPVLVGGHAFIRAPDLWRRLGAAGWAADLRVGLVLARRTIRAGAGAA
jgi:MerR family transcriptional regulator, light-induced transcriptional regulator